MNILVCLYCETVNDLNREACIACGAPLENKTPQPMTGPEPESLIIQPLENMNQVDELERVQEVLKTTASSYSIILRTVGESLAIILAALVLGVIGAVTDQAFWAIVGAIMVGVTVGIVVKNFWPTVLGAPLGALVGMVIGWILWAAGAGTQWVVYTSAAGAIVGAVIGTRRRRTGLKWWERLRPMFGLLGALLFVAIGLLIGEGFQQLTRLIIGS